MNTEFPIQIEFPEKRFPPQLRSIPLGLIAPHEAQALKNHGDQNLLRLAQRHGLSAQEAVAIIEDKKYCDRWKRTDGSREAIDASCKEAIYRLRELCEEYEKASPP